MEPQLPKCRRLMAGETKWRWKSQLLWVPKMHESRRPHRPISIVFYLFALFDFHGLPLLKMARKLRLTQGWGKPDTKNMWRNQGTIYLRNLMELLWSWWFKTQETCDACPFWGIFKCSKWWQAILFWWCWSCWSLKGEQIANPEQESRKVCCQTCEWRCRWWDLNKHLFIFCRASRMIWSLHIFTKKGKGSPAKLMFAWQVWWPCLRQLGEWIKSWATQWFE